MTIYSKLGLSLAAFLLSASSLMGGSGGAVASPAEKSMLPGSALALVGDTNRPDAISSQNRNRNAGRARGKPPAARGRTSGARPPAARGRPPGYRPPSVAGRPPGYRPPGYRPPGYRPPGYRPPGYRPGYGPGYRPPVYVVRPYGWHGAYWGAAVAGVTLGTIIAVAASTPPPAPSPDLCWTWADPEQTQGYWYYCSGP